MAKNSIRHWRAVFGTAILAQFGFGKIRNPQNIQKQVNDDANS